MTGHELPGDAARGDDDYRLLFQRLLQRFSEHARALERLDVLVTAQAAELSELREASLVPLRLSALAEAVSRVEAQQATVVVELAKLRDGSRLLSERVAQLEDDMDRAAQQPASRPGGSALRPWWLRWWRW
jgi:hypothetical protein